jgi:cell wall assembly regulator SMI1
MAKAKTRAPTTGPIDQRLAAIDALIKTKAVTSGLAPPAKPAAITKLRKLFGGTVPADVRAWFAWHDGQRPTSHEGLIPETNWSAMSCAALLETHAFLTGASPDDAMQPWKPTWIPLFLNGGGDHLCLDRETNAIVTYYHDDASRPKAYESFAAVIDAIENGYRRMKAAKGFAAPAITAWTVVPRAPTEAQLAEAPAGIAYAFAAQLPMGVRQHIMVKLGDDRWLSCRGTDLVHAVAQWKQHAARPPAESSGYYKRTWDVWYSLKQYKKTLKVGS